MKLSINLVTYNGAKYIPYLFASLKKQTFQDWGLLVLDNNSRDKTIELIKKELNNFDVQHQIIENKENIGFAGGHNKLYSLSKTDYFLILNQDIFLEPDCLEKMVKFLDENSETAAVAPRLMNWNAGLNGAKPNFTNIVDSLGLKVLRNRRVMDKYSQKRWEDIKGKLNLSYHTENGAMKVFGLSGALAIYRRNILEKIELAPEKIFDENYTSYKEDVDLAFRLQNTGYDSRVLLDVIAFHSRSAGTPEKTHDNVAISNKRQQSALVKYYSYKNHLATLYKNEYWQNFLLDSPWILWYELKKFIYFLLFDRPILGGLKELWQNRKKLKQQRRQIKSLRKVDWQDTRSWWR